MMNKFATYTEAREAAMRLGLNTKAAYMQGYRQDPRLPADPHRMYKGDWVDWYVFLGSERPGAQFYQTYTEASEAAQRLGLNSSNAYGQGYRQDTRLPAVPYRMYKGDWVDWYAFLGTQRPDAHYPTYTEASEAAQRLGLNSIKAYQQGYKQDPGLPCEPNTEYAHDWVDWYAFLEIERPGERFYQTYIEASEAAQRLGLNSQAAYKQGYRQDPRLPAVPYRMYTEDWVDWYVFLGTKRPGEQFYQSYIEASEAAQRLGLNSSKTYQQGYKQDPRLPLRPSTVYARDWVDWYAFLGTQRPETHYPSHTEASEAAQRLGLNSSNAYGQGYRQDPRLPCEPSTVYAHDWVDWYAFLGTQRPEAPYPTYTKASEAARRLGLNSIKAYRQRYQQDPRLPAVPSSVYKEDWVDWYVFLGTKRPGEYFYQTYTEASKAAQQLGFNSQAAYRKSCKIDPRLPSKPNMAYKEDWVDWYVFLGKIRPGEQFYQTYSKAKEAAMRLGLNSSTAYQQGYRKDPRLPADPYKMYKGDWVDWYVFLGTERRAEQYYQTYTEAKEAAMRLGFDSMRAYKIGYRQDLRLPLSPMSVYKEDWVGWYVFLGTHGQEPIYDTYTEASEAAQQLGLSGVHSYQKNYQLDPRLPSKPEKAYKGDWVDWYAFLGTQRPEAPYPTYTKASEAARRLGLNSIKAYRQCYRQDPRLPAEPSRTYKGDWVDWYVFLGLERPGEQFYQTYTEASEAVRRLGLNSIKAYQQGYRQDPRLPCEPSTVYARDWVDWYVFFATQRPEAHYPTYAEASEAAQRLGLNSSNAYKQGYRQDLRLPSSPDRVYTEDWVGWDDFLGSTLNLILERYPKLLSAVEDYIEEGTNQVSKHSHLKAFVREVLDKQGLPDTPGALLNRDIPFPERAYEAFVYATGETLQRSRHNISVTFFDWLLDTHCSDENDEGELTPLPGFRNPLRTILKGFLDQLPSPRPRESTKPVLPMRAILRAKNHLIPAEAKTFSDLHALHPFLEDCWVEIDTSLVDQNDLNCVTRKVMKDRKPKVGARYKEEVTEIWSPVKLIANYCLFSMPLRGQQILWLDSGEGDENIPVWENGKFAWVKNMGPFVRSKRQIGFLQIGADGENSSCITTNKTSRKDGGYRIPYMPDPLAYWVIQLREWQSKYNPISELTSWTKIKLRQRTNKDILKRRGHQAFLFRDPASVACEDKFSPMMTTTAFTRTLPAILFHSQEEGQDLATHQPSRQSDNYSSQFTPHSLRVSLITAYVVDGAAPLPVISKLVGHASLVMTIYYTKVGHAKMRSALDEAEKIAVEQNIDRIQDLILQKKIDEARPELIATDRASMDRFVGSDWPSSAFQIMNIGICPMGGAACDEGGELLLERKGEKFYTAVPNGYLGARNCPRCRFFITGPAFLGGLSAIASEVILEINVTRREYHELEDKIQELEDERFDLESAGKPFKNQYKFKTITAAYEEKAKKLDILATDFQHFYRLISQSTELLNNYVSDKKQLIVSDQYVEIGLQLEEQQTDFRLLAEVCSNAEIYASSSSSRALPLLSQMLDKLAANNGISPSMFQLTEEQQLKAANQVVKLIMQSAQNNWHTADQLITGQVMLEDLGTKTEIMQVQKEIKLIMHGSLNLLASYEK